MSIMTAGLAEHTVVFYFKSFTLIVFLRVEKEKKRMSHASVSLAATDKQQAPAACVWAVACSEGLIRNQETCDPC